jgi:MoaA/NifB/PqqE/SkfB family radical SAM enzyme
VSAIEDELKKFELNLGFHFSDSLNKLFVYPTNVYMPVTNRCNLKCWMCDVVMVPRPVLELSLDEIKRALDEVKSWGGDQIILLTGGEPLMRKDIFPIIDHSISLGLRTEMISNGTLIDAITAERLLESGLHMIAVSLDSVTPRIHNATRGVKGAFDGAVRGIRNLVTAKEKRGSPVWIEVWTTITNLNLEELSAIAHFTNSLGIDYLIYHPVIIGQVQMQNAINDGFLWIPKSRIPLLEREIGAIKEFSKSHPHFNPWLHDPDLLPRYFRKELTTAEWKCNPYMFLSVTIHGQLQICGDPFGDIRQESITSILRSAESFKVRKKMKSCRTNCLQSCWARPEADQLARICGDFHQAIAPYPPIEREMVLARALDVLEDYLKKLQESPG